MKLSSKIFESEVIFFSLFDDNNKLLETSKIIIKNFDVKKSIFKDHQVFLGKHFGAYLVENDVKKSIFIELDKSYFNIFKYVDDDFVNLKKPFSKKYNIIDFLTVDDKIIIQDKQDDIYFDFFFDNTTKKVIFECYRIDENKNKLALEDIELDIPFKKIYELFDLYDKYQDFDTRFNLVDKKLDELQNLLKNLNIDLSPLEKKIDSTSKTLSNLIKNQKIDLSPVQTKIDKLPQVIQEFFTLNITDLSLNGSNGAKYADGEQVVIEGYPGIWEILGSFPVLVDDNNLTIMYKVKKDNKVMSIPSAFVSLQGA